MSGGGQAAARPVWIWLHGFGASPAVWGDPAGWLPEVRHRMFSFAGCDTVAAMRDRLYEMIGGESAPVSLVGWSFGGMLALETMLELWERQGFQEQGASADGDYEGKRLGIERLILVGATLRFVGERRDQAWPERIVRRMRTQLAADADKTLRAFAESMLSAGERASSDAASLSRLAAPTDFSPSGLDAALAYLLETDLTERWERFAARAGNKIGDGDLDIVWLHGELDPICPVGAIAGVQAGRKVIFPGAGHAPFVTQQDLFIQTVRRIAYERRSDQ
ncbi:MAG: alpha/beta hydrolase [Paenibacillus sp.]|nr:alpha/beta hydrolase [Paenibacillus sp.]